jgi:peptide/nickel transport system permease protein
MSGHLTVAGPAGKDPAMSDTGTCRPPATTTGLPAGDAEAITTKERTQLQLILRRFVRHKVAMVSLGAFLLIVAWAFLGPLVWPHSHTIDRSIPQNVPWFQMWEHPLGTTQLGHDMVGRLMKATQNSILVGLVASTLGVTIGTIWGSVAGFYRGWVDAIMMRIVDVIIVVPLLVIYLVVAGSVRGGASWYGIAILIGLFAWTIDARIVRGQVLSLREREYIEAARAMGASDARIILRHLIPNTTSIIVVAFTLAAPLAIIAEATLSFLGFGIRPPDISLGQMIAQAQTAVFVRPWLFYLPGLIIVAIVLAINFIGEGLRDALDPRQTHRK